MKNKIYSILLAMGLAGCAGAPVREEVDVLPTPNFEALEEKVEALPQKNLMEDPVTKTILEGVDYEAPDKKPLPKKGKYFGYDVLEAVNFSDIKNSRVKQVITGNYDCAIRKIDEKEVKEYAVTFERMLTEIVNSVGGQLEFYGSSKGMDAVLLKQGDKMYLAVGKEGLELEDLYYFDSFRDCEAEVLKGFFKNPENEDILGWIKDIYKEI
jgi:hypothetical protein